MQLTDWIVLSFERQPFITRAMRQQWLNEARGRYPVIDRRKTPR